MEKYDNGNSLTIKTLMQVSDITSASYSEDNQRIIVEVTDEWTWNLVQKIIRSKQVDGKCNIVPVRVNQILGKMMAQFSLMPELNSIYNELLSNKGASFYTARCEESDELSYIEASLGSNSHVIPLTVQSEKNKNYCYYMALNERDVNRKSDEKLSGIPVRLNKDFWLEKKKIIILGHNSKCHEIMEGFASFLSEWSYKEVLFISALWIMDVFLKLSMYSLKRGTTYSFCSSCPKSTPFLDFAAGTALTVVMPRNWCSQTKTLLLKISIG